MFFLCFFCCTRAQKLVFVRPRLFLNINKTKRKLFDYIITIKTTRDQQDKYYVHIFVYLYFCLKLN